MNTRLLITDAELRPYGSGDDWSDKLHALLRHQQQTWELLRAGYENLAQAKTREFEIEDSTILVQCNPGRLASTAANVEESAVTRRRCFLCADNLPPAQRAIRYGDEYLILANPFPIFPEHFTIPHVRHTAQEIRSALPVLLRLSEDLATRYTVFYNGPKCGASAPDHLHIQAGSKGFMPVDHEYETLVTELGEKIADVNGLLVFAVGKFLRPFFAFESDDAALLQRAIDRFLDTARTFSGRDEEPMINILSSYHEGEWRVMVFPRTQHRPSFFGEEGDAFLISPAAVDLGGVLTLPRAHDFDRITPEIIVRLYGEITMQEEQCDRLTTLLRPALMALRT